MKGGFTISLRWFTTIGTHEPLVGVVLATKWTWHKQRALNPVELCMQDNLSSTSIHVQKLARSR